ncbi:MAG: TonB-dependent receptor plug domain-containing protein, partial [Mucilaginibacter sp.]
FDLSKIKILQEVKINDYHSSNILGPGHADQVLHEKDFENTGGMMSTKLNGLLRGITIINGVPVSRGLKMNIYLDYEQISSLDQVNPNDIETVEVLKFATASIYGVNGGAGVIILTSKQGKATNLNDIASIGVLPIAVQGFYKARVFYAPKYDASIPPDNGTDLRSTIYWQPELTTDKDGNASFGFYNADGKGSYRVVVEGIDEKGNIGRQVYRYKVQ